MTAPPRPRACRIICTLGPSTTSAEQIGALIRAGMDVARLNFSHGDHIRHRQAAEELRSQAAAVGREVALLQDLQGPKVRVGRVRGTKNHERSTSGSAPSVELPTGSIVILESGPEISPGRVGVDFPDVVSHLSAGQRVYLDDGRIELRLEELRQEADGARVAKCIVRDGGRLYGRKGVIFPDARLPFPLLEEKDLEDARFGVELGVDVIAMSFVRGPDEVRAMRKYLQDWGAPDTAIIAKIEDREGVESLEAILACVDGVLIARGDMGVTYPRERVPALQRKIIRVAAAHGVPVITATQMLESMIEQPTPTRAEVSDVHLAVSEGADAVMLSAETAAGDYPVKAVEEMDRIVRAAEEDVLDRRGAIAVPQPSGDVPALMAEATAKLAHELSARAILTFSQTGATLRALAAARPSVPVHGVVPDQAILRRLLFYRGLELRVGSGAGELRALIEASLRELEVEGRVTRGDRVIVLAGPKEAEGELRHSIRVCDI